MEQDTAFQGCKAEIKDYGYNHNLRKKDQDQVVFWTSFQSYCLNIQFSHSILSYLQLH